MTNTYTSLAGVVNIVFTVAILCLIISRWSSAGIIFRCVMIFALLIFPVLQPLLVYGRAVKETENKEVPDTTLTFDENGMTIQVKKHVQHITYQKMNNIVWTRTLLYVLPDEQHAYILTNRIVGAQKQELYDYVHGNIIACQPEKMTKKDRKKAQG